MRLGNDPEVERFRAELAAFLQREFRLAKQKLPEVLYVVPGLPMTTTGKVDKRELRDRVAGGVADVSPDLL